MIDAKINVLCMTGFDYLQYNNILNNNFYSLKKGNLSGPISVLLYKIHIRNYETNTIIN